MASWLFSFFTSFFLALIITPVIIKVAKIKHLVDEPKEDRKVHQRSIPTVGGIGIFAAFLFSLSFWAGWGSKSIFFPDYQFYQYFVACLLLLFFMGVKDDLTGLSPFKKLFALVIVGLIMVFLAPMRVTNMGGLFGIGHLPMGMSIALSLFTYIVVVNSINLIDGIDGLAGGVGAIAGVAFGLWFYMVGNLFFAVLGFALAGALIGFLVFNFSPAKIFMGDGGSLIVGFILCVLAMKLISYEDHQIPAGMDNLSRPVLAMTVLAYPLIDTIRVFIVRTVTGRSPLSADKNHIHHRLIGNGFSHRKASAIIYAFCSVMLITLYFLKELTPTMSFLVMFTLGLILIGVLVWVKPIKR
ncbi:MAG: MraY family glycosyltransferase [Bacteroidota bacterium]